MSVRNNILTQVLSSPASLTPLPPPCHDRQRHIELQLPQVRVPGVFRQAPAIMREGGEQAVVDDAIRVFDRVGPAERGDEVPAELEAGICVGIGVEGVMLGD